MNSKNRKFVAALGLFWLMASVLMLTRGRQLKSQGIYHLLINGSKGTI